jgi:dTDP-4-amino-4,6-dideoxygalactose transaminase
MIPKNRLEEFALFGGAPAFAEKLHVGSPNIGDRDRLLARFNSLLDDRRLTNNGPYVQEFERKLSEFLGVKHCIAMCNATVALEIVIRALGLTGEVIVPSFTFIATAHALQWQQITPIFCDIDPRTHTLDPKRIEEIITPRTTGIIGVHLWGHPCDIEALADVVARRNLHLIFDAAHALGFGDAEVFSFHATKFINSFEGGAVATNNDEIARKVRLMKNFGFAGYDNVIYIGMNGKMSEIAAAMGLTSLESVEEIIAINRRNYEAYCAALQNVPGVTVFRHNSEELCNYQYVVLEIDEAVTEISRDSLLKILWAENVLARRYFFPGCHRMEPYRSYYPHAGLTLPETNALVERILLLPTGTTVTVEQIETVCQILITAIRQGEELSELLTHRQASNECAFESEAV